MQTVTPEKILAVSSVSFRTYGGIVDGYPCAELIKRLAQTDAPADCVNYIASLDSLESCAEFAALQNGFFGGLACQAGVCSGYTTRVDALEYHRCSELLLFGTDAVLLLGHRWEIEDGQYDFGRLEAFFVPRGTLLELFATTLHYSPCAAAPNEPFRAAVVLPRGTNGAYPLPRGQNAEARLLEAANKWVVHAARPAEILPLLV